MEKTEQRLEYAKVEIEMSWEFHDFIKGYLQFFAHKTTFESFCRDAIYDAVITIYRELKSVGTADIRIPTHIQDSDWFNRWVTLAGAAMPDEEEDGPSNKITVDLTNREFEAEVNRAAKQEGWTRDEFIRHSVRKELETLRNNC